MTQHANDRELLELAAKAAGLPYIKPLPEYDGSLGLEVGSDNPMRCRTWNPLTYDGDALQLAVKLGLLVDISLAFIVKETIVTDGTVYVVERHDVNPYAATRRAIVLAAAEIGKNGGAV